MKRLVIALKKKCHIDIPSSCSKCSFEIAHALDCVMCNRLVQPEEFDFWHTRHPECPMQIIED